MDVRQTDDSKLELIPQDEDLRMSLKDIEKLCKEKEAAEKDSIYYKEHYIKVTNDMKDLFKVINESSKNKKELKDIIEQKNKIISELKAADKSSELILKEEILNATEKLAEEKKQCLNLQEKLQKVNEELQICHMEKDTLLKQLHEMHSEISNYDEIRERLMNMTEKQVKLESFYKNHDQTSKKCNESDTFMNKYDETKKKSQQKTETSLLETNTRLMNDLQEIKDELAKCEESKENLIKQINMEIKANYDLRQRLKELNCELEKQMHEKSLVNNKTFVEQEEQFIKLNLLVENYKIEKNNLIHEVTLLKNRISNIEAISKDLRQEIILKDKKLEEQSRENKEMNEKICRLSVNEESIQLIERQFQAVFLKREIAIKNAADEKLKSALNQLQDTKKELHDTINKQYEIEAQSRIDLDALHNKMMNQEQKIIDIENKKRCVENELNLISMNKKYSDCNTDSLQKKLVEVTEERDKKIQVILQLRKASDEMQMLAAITKAEQKRLYEENDCLRDQAFAAKQKLDVCIVEQQSQIVEIEMMREKLISLDKNASMEKSKLKKIESQLKQELLDVRSQNKVILTENNKIIHEKEMIIKQLQDYEKNIACCNKELGKKNQELKQLQYKHDKLNDKLTECKEIINEYNLGTENFVKDRQDYYNKYCKLESTIEQFKEDILNKEKTISELLVRQDSLLAENTVLQNAENESQDLKQVQYNLKLQNDELKEKCSFLENDLNVLQQELEIAEKNIILLQERNSILEESKSEMEKENILLKKSSDECATFEKEKQVLNGKYNDLIKVEEKLYGELRNVREELEKSKEDQSRLEQQIGNLQKSEIDLKEKCFCLVISNDNLTHELNREKSLTLELYDEIENLKINHFSVASDKERLQQEKIEFENLLVDKDSKINSLETSNAELTKKCCDFEEKELSYKEEMNQKTKETTVNLEVYASLRSKYEALGPKLGKYVMQYKNMKQANIDLKEKINVTNQELKILHEENLGMKSYCKNIELQMNENKSENENLRIEINLLKVQAQEFQKKQNNECSQEVKNSMVSTTRRKNTGASGDPLVVLDNLVNQVKNSSSPAAVHLLKSCKHIKELIIKEREDFPTKYLTNSSAL